MNQELAFERGRLLDARCLRSERSEVFDRLSRALLSSEIRMISLRREGNSRGKRLLAVESVRHYLRTLDAHQNQSPPAASKSAIGSQQTSAEGGVALR
jgi:hypothetical protein